MRAVPFFAGCLIAAVAGAAAAQPQPAQEPAPRQPQPAQPPAQAQAQAQPQPAQPQPAQEPAQPQPAQEPASAQPQPQPAPEAPEARDDAGWRLYHEAFDALLQGKRARAAGLAAQLRREHPGHPAAALVATPSLAVADTGARVRTAKPEAPSGGANAELALFQTMHGLTLGIELCVLVECDSPGAGFGLTLLGGLTGAVVSLKMIGPVTSGQRALLNNGTTWGAFNALMAMLAFAPAIERAQSVALCMLGGQTAGLVAGALLFERRPTAGQVALASSGGQWGAALMWLTLVAATGDNSDQQRAGALLLGADVGLGVGAYLAKIWPDISRAQTLVIDAGGIVGAVGGGALGVLLTNDVGDRTTAGMAAVGAAFGLGAAAYFTRHWGESADGGAGGARAVLMPAEHGRGGLVGLAGAW